MILLFATIAANGFGAKKSVRCNQVTRETPCNSQHVYNILNKHLSEDNAIFAQNVTFIRLTNDGYNV